MTAVSATGATTNNAGSAIHSPTLNEAYGTEDSSILFSRLINRLKELDLEKEYLTAHLQTAMMENARLQGQLQGHVQAFETLTNLSSVANSDTPQTLQGAGSHQPNQEIPDLVPYTPTRAPRRPRRSNRENRQHNRALPDIALTPILASPEQAFATAIASPNQLHSAAITSSDQPLTTAITSPGQVITAAIAYNLPNLSLRETDASVEEASRGFNDLYYHTYKFIEDFCIQKMRIKSSENPPQKTLAAALGAICNPSLIQSTLDSVERSYLLAASFNRYLHDCTLTMISLRTFPSPVVAHIERCQNALLTYNAGIRSEFNKPKLLAELISSLWLQLVQEPGFNEWCEGEVHRLADAIIRFLDPVIPSDKLREAQEPMRRIVSESFGLAIYLKQRAFDYVFSFDRHGDELRPTMMIAYDIFLGLDLPPKTKMVKIGVTPTLAQRDYLMSAFTENAVREIATVRNSSVVVMARPLSFVRHG